MTVAGLTCRDEDNVKRVVAVVVNHGILSFADSVFKISLLEGVYYSNSSLLRQEEVPPAQISFSWDAAGKGIINLVNCIAGDTETLPSFAIDIDVPAEEARDPWKMSNAL